MTINEYQEKAMTTCMASSENFSYMMLNLVGEVGEFASKIAKAVRKGQVGIGHTYISNGVTMSTSHIDFAPMLYTAGQDEVNALDTELQKEAGDIAWQLAGLCHVMGWNLEDICQMNLDKLQSRKQRHVIDGNGDNR